MSLIFVVQGPGQQAGSELLELMIYRNSAADRLANVVFDTIVDRNERMLLSVRDQNTFDENLRKRRLMTLIHLWLVQRYKVASVHYVSPTEDNKYQAAKMQTHGIFREVHGEIGDIIVAEIDHERISELLDPEHEALRKLIEKRS